MRTLQGGPTGRAGRVESMTILISLAGLLGAGLVLEGCGGQTPAPATPDVPDTAAGTAGPSELVMTHMVAADTEYYLDGPQQARPPDGTLAAGTEVGLVREAGSYSLVRMAGGLEAYVATDSLEPLEQ